MALERTFSIIKPDAVKKNAIGEIYDRFERAGLRIVGARMLNLTSNQAEAFYAVHKDKPFYDPLVKFMASGPVMVQILEGENAIEKNRELMGPPTSRKRRQEPSGRISPVRFVKMRFTVPIARSRQTKKLVSFSPKIKSVPELHCSP